MKTRYLSNKIKDRKYLSNYGFPDKPKFDEITSFLLDHGFKEYNLKKIRYSEFANLTERRFGVYEYDTGPDMIEVTISDKGETTEDNPEFTLFTTDDGSLYFGRNNSTNEKFIGKKETYSAVLQYFHTYEEFLDEINKSIRF